MAVARSPERRPGTAVAAPGGFPLIVVDRVQKAYPNGTVALLSLIHI